MRKVLLFSFLLISLHNISYSQNSNIAVSKPTIVAPIAVPPANSTLRGRVYYEDTGRPVKRASIMFVKGDVTDGPGETTALTDGNGNFEAKNVRAGTYYAVINAPGVLSPIAYADLSTMAVRGPGSLSDTFQQAFINFEKIVVDGINESYVEIAAKRGGAIGGRITYENGDPAIGVRVELLRKVDGKYVSVVASLSSIVGYFAGGGGGSQTDDRGIYRFPGLPTGEYLVKATESAQHAVNEEKRYGPDGFLTFLFGGSSMLNFYFPDALDPKDAQVINVLAGQEQGEINIIIPDKSLFGVSGKVISMKDKKPVTGARVSLLRKGSTESSLFNMISRQMNMAVTDAEGNWRFKEIPRGNYTVTVVPDNSREGEEIDYSSPDFEPGSYTRLRQQGPKFAKSFKELQLEEKDVADLIVELGYGAAISGTVVTENNKDLPRTVTIQAIGENDEFLASDIVRNYKSEYASNTVNAQPAKLQNDFKLENVMTGKVKLKIFADDDDYYVKSARSGMIDLLTTPFDVKEGELLAGIKVVLAKDAGTLKGRIIDDKDRPAPGVALMLVPTDTSKRSSNFYRNIRSGGDGKFEIKLQPGEYYLVFTKPGMAESDKAAFDSWLNEAVRSADKVSVEPEGTANVTLRKPAP